VILVDRGTWDWNGSHRVCTSYTHVAQVGHIAVLIDTDWERVLPCSAPPCIYVDINVNPDHDLFLRNLKRNHD
jgi:hypothetical protein